MRCLLILAALVFWTPSLLAQDKVNEAAEGWLQLFDGDSTFGWDIQGEGKVVKGVLVLGGTKATTAVSALPLGNCELEVTDRAAKGKGSEMRLADKSKHLGDDKFSTFRGSIKNDGKPLAFFVPAGDVAEVSRARMRPLGMKPLFNGKDLTGWKVFPGKKSIFTVKDGAINIKDGPGDLQTEGKYGDFILQLECKSNGKHLNSGVFFRCRDGEYQNGYEAQIRNQFTAEATQDYVVEKYDPKTNKLLDKEKVKSTAVDFGTGAIYRRIPARKEVAKDGEWFTLTVVAHGNHLATWVNGVQVVDWFDHRPPSDNARTGCRLEPGHISFQGHDPTTDLSFRNIRIAEIK